MARKSEVTSKALPAQSTNQQSRAGYHFPREGAVISVQDERGREIYRRAVAAPLFATINQVASKEGVSIDEVIRRGIVEKVALLEKAISPQAPDQGKQPVESQPKGEALGFIANNHPYARPVTKNGIESFSTFLGKLCADLDKLHVAWMALYDHAEHYGGLVPVKALEDERKRAIHGMWMLLSDCDELAYDGLGELLNEWDEVMEPALKQLCQNHGGIERAA